jgi:hypothetical protein
MHRRHHGEPGKVGGDVGMLLLAQRLAQRPEPGWGCRHAAMDTAGSVMPSGSTVLLARAM